MTNKLSDEEIQLVSDLLARLEPGFLPYPLFRAVTRIVATPIVEIVPLRRSGDSIQVLLKRRDADDPLWPSQLHTPGTVIRATDTLETAFGRLINEELGGATVSDPIFVKNILHDSGRGLESSQIYWAEVSGESPLGEFYDIERLPETLIKAQMDFIPAAIENYKNRMIKTD